MTLQEYINQKNPSRNPRVFLAPEEVEMLYLWTDAMGVKFYHVTIPIIAEHYCIEGSYIMRSNDLRLFTIDIDGNPKRASVFALNIDAYQNLTKNNIQVKKI